MTKNSIKNSMIYQSKISEIKLLLPTNENIVILVVEGSDDEKFLKKFVDNNVKICESCSGCSDVERIIESDVIKDKRVIGIRDRDYTQIKNIENLFYYDKCCLEMMILCEIKICKALYAEFYNGKLSVNELMEKIFEILFPISNFRKYNELKKLGINFKGIMPKKFLDENLKPDYEKFITELKIVNKKNNKTSCIDLYSEQILKKEKPENVDEYYEITNGHDFVELLYEVLKKYNQQFPKKTIPSVLRTAFDNDLLKKTELFKSIKQYESKNNINVFS